MDHIDTAEMYGDGAAEVADELPYLQPSSSVQLLLVDGKPSGIQLPSSVELQVTETEPGFAGAAPVFWRHPQWP